MDVRSFRLNFEVNALLYGLPEIQQLAAAFENDLTRSEPVARLNAIASHQGLTVFDLSDAFDLLDPGEIEIAAWDDHPNAIGHRRLFLALARAMVKDLDIYRLLFRQTRVEPGAG